MVAVDIVCWGAAVYSVPFYVDARNQVLQGEGGKWLSPNIGGDGANLTIVLLSLNRYRYTVRLIESLAHKVPHFAGKILIADNGSAPEELSSLKKYLNQDCPFSWNIIEFGVNYGVAGGRNRAFREVDTDWILSLDNDIYFIEDPFPALQRDIGLLACHFLNVPLLNSDHSTLYCFGGHLQTLIQEGRPRLNFDYPVPPGSPIAAIEEVAPSGRPFLCSFLLGGGSLLRRDSFLAMGGFDDAMIIGFEDVDFSLRLLRAGVKVGASAVCALVHDHPPADSDPDREYERRRFSREILYNSAMHLERKTGFRVWGSEVDSWLAESERKQGLAGPPERHKIVAGERGPGLRLPRVALVTDVDGWAFSNISEQIRRHLSDKYSFDIIPLTRLAEIEATRFRERGSSGFFVEGGGSGLGHLLIRSHEYDIIHFFWREYLMLIGTPLLDNYAAFVGLSSCEFYERFVRPACITTAVYDHLWCDPEHIEARRRLFNELAVAYTVSSNRLDEHYKSIPGLKAPSMVIEDGVDTDLFRPANLDRFNCIAEREIVVGWVGNSQWAASIEDFKGVHTILIPAIEQLRAEGVPIRLELADRQKVHVPHAEMPKYYSAIDVYVCTSKIEGTPNPILEAMACGVPVVSTNVGIVPQVFGPKQESFILKERSIDCLKVALRRLASDPSLFSVLSEENLCSIAPWAWRRQVQKFDQFFEMVMSGRSAHVRKADAHSERIAPARV